MWFLISMAFAGPPPSAVESPPCLEASGTVRRHLRKNAASDQRERREHQYDGMAERDAVRLAYVHEQRAAQRVCTAKDAHNAAVVLQHSLLSDDHHAAWALFFSACERGVSDACPWVGLAWDRHLVSKGEPQWYGTQWVARFDRDTQERLGMCLVALDGGATDAERALAHRDPLSEVVARNYAMNEQEAPKDLSLQALEEAGWVCEPAPWKEGS